MGNRNMFRIKVVDANFPCREDNNYVLISLSDAPSKVWKTDDLILVLMETLKYQRMHKGHKFIVEEISSEF